MQKKKSPTQLKLPKNIPYAEMQKDERFWIQFSQMETLLRSIDEHELPTFTLVLDNYLEGKQTVVEPVKFRASTGRLLS